MNRSPKTPLNTVMVDKDSIEQAHAGHGIPSQDPEAGAQFPLEPKDAEREARSGFVAGGMVAGATAGAALGVAIAGPVGVVVGGTVGAVVGALGAEAAGSVVNSEDSSSARTVGSTPKAGQTAADRPHK